MRFKVMQVYPYAIAVIVMFFALSSTHAAENTRHWNLKGMTKDKNYLLYCDTSNITTISEHIVRMNLKRVLSEQGIERFKKNYYNSLKEAEDKAGEKLQGSPEALLDLLILRETKEYIVDIDCRNNEMRVPPDKTTGFNFVVVNEIEPDTVIALLRDEFCPNNN